MVQFSLDERKHFINFNEGVFFIYLRNVLAIYERGWFLPQPYFNFDESKLLGHFGGSMDDATFTFFLKTTKKNKNLQKVKEDSGIEKVWIVKHCKKS